MSEDYIKVECPNCDKRLKIPKRKQHRKINCPKCRVQFRFSSPNPSYDSKQQFVVERSVTETAGARSSDLDPPGYGTPVDLDSPVDWDDDETVDNQKAATDEQSDEPGAAPKTIFDGDFEDIFTAEPAEEPKPSMKDSVDRAQPNPKSNPARAKARSDDSSRSSVSEAPASSAVPSGFVKTGKAKPDSPREKPDGTYSFRVKPRRPKVVPEKEQSQSGDAKEPDEPQVPKVDGTYRYHFEPKKKDKPDESKPKADSESTSSSDRQANPDVDGSQETINANDTALDPKEFLPPQLGHDEPSPLFFGGVFLLVSGILICLLPFLGFAKSLGLVVPLIGIAAGLAGAVLISLFNPTSGKPNSFLGAVLGFVILSVALVGILNTGKVAVSPEVQAPEVEAEKVVADRGNKNVPENAKGKLLGNDQPDANPNSIPANGPANVRGENQPAPEQDFDLPAKGEAAISGMPSNPVPKLNDRNADRNPFRRPQHDPFAKKPKDPFQAGPLKMAESTRNSERAPATSMADETGSGGERNQLASIADKRRNPTRNPFIGDRSARQAFVAPEVIRQPFEITTGNSDLAEPPTVDAVNEEFASRSPELLVSKWQAGVGIRDLDSIERQYHLSDVIGERSQLGKALVSDELVAGVDFIQTPNFHWVGPFDKRDPAAAETIQIRHKGLAGINVAFKNGKMVGVQAVFASRKGHRLNMAKAQFSEWVGQKTEQVVSCLSTGNLICGMIVYRGPSSVVGIQLMSRK